MGTPTVSEQSSSLNVMVDIETFGYRPRALVVSIGAIAFTTQGVASLSDTTTEFHAVLSWEAALVESRFEKNPESLAWWRDTKPEAYKRLQMLMMESTLNTTQLLEQFCKWVAPFCEKRAKVWANSPSFDLVILENAAKEVGLRFPVAHNAENDYRTLTDLVYGSSSKPRVPENIAHDALADARFQASVCTEALQRIEHWKQRNAATPA